MKAWNSTLRPGKPLKRTSFKRRSPKKRSGYRKAYLEACRGELCYLRIPGVCIGGVESIVPCHSNQSRHGKAMGLKARDEYTVPGCYACHQAIDQSSHYTKQQKFDFWNSAFERWEPVRARKLQTKNNPTTGLTVSGFDSHNIKKGMCNE